MGLFDRFKRKSTQLPADTKPTSAGNKTIKATAKSDKTSVAQNKTDQTNLEVISQKKNKIKTVQKQEKTYLEEKQAGKILIKPLITEKATNLGQINKYAFMVSRQATRNDIKRAIEEVYHFSPIKINTLNYKGTQIRYRRQVGRTKKWKKAIVTLAKGDRIELYEHQ